MYFLFIVSSLAALAAASGSVSPKNGTATTPTGPTGTGHAGLSTGTAPAGDPRSITAHPDGQCMQNVNQFSNNTFTIQNGFPNYTTIETPAFPGAEAKTGGGYDVWWSIPAPGQGCRTMVMIPYTQDRGTPGYPGGKEIINAGHAGCYFGNVPSETDLLLSFCCGSDDCTKASLNSTSLLSSPSKRRDVGSTLDRKRKRDSPAKKEPAVKQLAAAKAEAHSGSAAARAKGALEERFYYPPPPQDKGCTYHSGQPFSQAGQQVVVTSGQSCPESPCSIAVAQTISFSTTASSSQSQTITNSLGESIAVKAGVDFLEDVDVTATISHDFSDAIQKSTGMDVMKGNSTTITNTVALKLGNMGAVTFTPVYKCWTGPLDCGKGLSDPIDVCQPDFSGANGQLKGEYNAVVYG